MISLIHPSRQRAEIALNAKEEWMSKSYHCEVQHIISVDQDDPELEIYRDNFDGSTFVIGNNKNAVQAINHAAKYALGDILVVMSDDFECFVDWDLKIEQELLLYGSDTLLKTSDGVQPWIVTLPIMGMAYYERFGYVYNPIYEHMFCDTELTHVADITGRLKFASDLLFRHNHYTVKKQARDNVSTKADSTWDKGMKTYLDRVQSNFGLGDIDVFKLTTPQAAPHLAWLKKYIK